ncbi:hypothetical protein GOP47_0011608 [Adiantum capillus-veneris]|uniref:CG-1 domain-containing protein n=1 Tax=Adiantum capillus-veneris TaxID=13818 RepID=A0A9D4UTL8_ADICA|nr:hypothetical protein GOP47_0011608 [Adiantum capillus-veneris]
MSRWLRPSEIYEILTNHFRFSISKEPVNLPPSGTLVLFDRKMLRNFRRDGHPWRKKKDNKTVKEAHEHLKVGSEEKIHVYYAHGEGESSLQRRVYWLLDKALEHIVLVHYLEVKEVRSNMNLRQPTTPVQNTQHESNTTYKPLLSSYFTGVEPVLSSESSAGPASDPSLEFSELNSNEKDDFDKFYFEDLRSTGETGFGNTQLESQFLSSRMSSTCEQVNYQGGGGNVNRSHIGWSNTSQMVDPTTNFFGHSEDHVIGAVHMPMSNYCFQNVVCEGAPIGLQGPYESQVYVPEASCLSTTIAYSMQSENSSFVKREKCVSDGTHNAELNLQMSWLDNGDEVLKKLDSLDRWMQRELPVENKTSPLAPSPNSSSVLGSPMYEDKTSLQDRAQPRLQSPLTEEMTPSFKQQLFFEITDYSPTWSFASEAAKVIITGHFNGDVTDFDKIDWYCIYGDKEVRAEVVQLGVLRFVTPKNVAPGKISFHITDGTKQPCSDVIPFELKEDIQTQKQSTDAGLDKAYEDTRLQCKLAHLLLDSIDHSKTKPQKELASMPSEAIHLTDAVEQEWVHLDNLLDKRSIDVPEVKDLLLQLILKSMMIDLIVKRPSSDRKSWRCFNSSGQNALHLASALGYEWVLNILKVSGMSIDFRDKQGWTALHWAAYYGRESMVAALLVAGARPGTISDPTPENKAGCTPADVAASAGHDGLAGYLSEQDLVSHLRTLTLAETDRDKESANDEGHRVVEYLRRSMSLRRSIKTVEDELALEDSLSAIGNATISSARIHAAFKEYFMRERLHAIEEEDEYGISVEEQIAVQKIQRAYRNHRERKKKESAALQIQNRFRVWKTRKNYLSLRQNVIKIQAYYRMHRARKHYHKIIWSVGVLEKAILRWRQRRKGLRGYQPEVPVSVESKDGSDFLQIGRKQAEDALDRAVLLVQSMVRSKLARQQYRRMKEIFDQTKASSSGLQSIDQVMREGDGG